MARLNHFEYIVHIKNLKEVLGRGILSHNEVKKLGIKAEMISNQQVMELRKNKLVEGDKTLWDYANVYFKARNPMLFNIIQKYGVDNLVILGLKPTITGLDGVRITNGNAANYNTEILPKSQLSEVFTSIQKVLDSDYWKEGDDSKRKMMAECLVPKQIPPSYISSIYVANLKVKQAVEKMLENIGEDHKIIVDTDLFFQGKVKEIINNISIIQGDMFFSLMQTLTISVNTIGIMGKGLASRAKYQFPDVYVHYQDLCKKGELVMGRPALYQRDKPISETLGAEYVDGEEPTWFLLFPTKTHYRYNSDIKGIESGLIWLKNNYEKLGIKSIALPALGCGLGNLSWSLVGPLMVKHLKDLKIDVAIYLPAEKDVPKEWTTKDFLLRNN